MKENPPDRIPMSVKEIIHDVCMQCRDQRQPESDSKEKYC